MQFVFAVKVLLGRIIIKTCAFVLMAAVQSNEHDKSRHGVFFRGTKFLLFTRFIDFKFLHCKHVNNSVAIPLATHGAHRAPGATLYWHNHESVIVSVAGNLAAPTPVC